MRRLVVEAALSADLTPLEVLRLYPVHDYSLVSALRSRVSVAGDHVALEYEDRRFTWRELEQASGQAARMLAGMGLKRGDRLLVMARNSDRHVILLLAAAWLGAIFTPLNPDFGVQEAGFVFGNAEPAVVACDTAALAVAREASALAGQSPIFICTDGDIEGAASFDRLMAQVASQGDAAPDPAGRADEIGLIIYTSGTTGFPKGVMHSQRNFVLAGEGCVQRMHLQAADRVLIVLPLFHINALFYSVSGAIAAGCAMVVSPKFSAGKFWSVVEERRITVVSVIEAMAAILAARPRREYRPGHRLRKAYGIRGPAAKVFRDEFGVPHLVSGYGMTEIPGVISPPFGQIQAPGGMGVVGRHPDPEVAWASAKVVDPEGADVAPDGVGELAVRSTIMMKGYYRDPEATAAAMSGGWFMTGDLVRRSADGEFYFVGRSKDIIRRRGENISGAELDRVLAAHPAILDAAAIGVPSPLGEEDILAVVQLAPGKAMTATEVVQWCRQTLSAIKTPRYIVFIDELPRTSTHKIAKNALRGDETLLARAFDREAPAPQRQGGAGP